ncbi:MAG: excinuclease ABC subunit UvrA [Candidatus Niyogibacteria bacterium]|nr:excinuclease ABC subunit UvrA [Candidatus Niyogibacteria bacterium]
MPTPATDVIRIRGAKAHNLKDVSLDIPKNKLIVITGLSGSGKSSLAFDTIYAEAERRFVESLSSYARQFLGVREKPDVESMDGLSPAIAIDQRSVARTPRSTVGTITEIYDYLRVLFARLGEPHCPQCGQAVKKQTIDEMLSKVSGLPSGALAMIVAPVITGRKGEHKKILQELKKKGFLRVRVDGGVMRTDEALDLELDPKRQHSIAVVVDRIVIGKDLDRERLRDSFEAALGLGKGIVLVASADDASGAKKIFPEMIFSEHFACPVCGISLPAIEPRLFSFNSPFGACPACTGLGSRLEVDPELVLPNKNLTLSEGAIQPWARSAHRVGRQSWYWWMLEDLAKRYKFSLDVPVKDLPQKIIDILLCGESPAPSSQLPAPSLQRASSFEGIIPNLERRWKETDSEWTRAEVERYMRIERCPTCEGRRLKPEALAVRLDGKSIADVSAFPCASAIGFMRAFEKKLSSQKTKAIAKPLAKEIVRRLQFLLDVGLEYLTLDRSSATLSGGEGQRVRLATQIGSGLSGVIYVLDEPSIGLHPRDHSRLIQTLKNLRDLGNTVIVVEHDRDTMANADWIIDLGPGAGRHGGEVIFEGTYKELLKAKTLTGEYLSGQREVKAGNAGARATRVHEKAKMLTVRGAAEHNLKNIAVEIPTAKFVCVTGVSGSGKSTLVNDILARALSQHFYGSREAPGVHKTIEGVHHVDKVIVVDQSPIGRTPRSNPATYTGAFTFIRDLFAATRDARARGYKAGRFSFNVKGGRCEECEGQGVKRIEMHFLPDIYVECEECKGTRYNAEALSIVYNGKTIAEVLDMTAEEALAFFKNIPQLKARIETLVEVGLSYMKLGQAATTLSGGEAQRVKLATELARKSTGKTLYILDEPTTGLHFEDTRKLLGVLVALVEKGNTVLVIEHNPDVIKNADWVIDLGPEGGEKGGMVVASASPEELARNKKSYTGQWLARD